jgi:hypothetical protein
MTGPVNRARRNPSVSVAGPRIVAARAPNYPVDNHHRSRNTALVNHHGSGVVALVNNHRSRGAAAIIHNRRPAITHHAARLTGGTARDFRPAALAAGTSVGERRTSQQGK